MIPQSIALIVIAVILCRMASWFFVALGGKDSAAWLRVSSWPNGPFAFKIIRMVFAALSGPSRIKPYSIPEATAGNPKPPPSSSWIILQHVFVHLCGPWW